MVIVPREKKTCFETTLNARFFRMGEVKKASGEARRRSSKARLEGEARRRGKRQVRDPNQSFVVDGAANLMGVTGTPPRLHRFRRTKEAKDRGNGNGGVASQRGWHKNPHCVFIVCLLRASAQELRK